MYLEFLLNIFRTWHFYCMKSAAAGLLSDSLTILVFFSSFDHGIPQVWNNITRGSEGFKILGETFLADTRQNNNKKYNKKEIDERMWRVYKYINCYL